MNVKLMQGDSFPIFIHLTQGGYVLTPDMVDDLEVCVGDSLQLLYSSGEVHFYEPKQYWYIWPTQAQTFELEAGSNKVEVRVKYKNQELSGVKGYTLQDKIKVYDTESTEVL